MQKEDVGGSQMNYIKSQAKVIKRHCYKSCLVFHSTLLDIGRPTPSQLCDPNANGTQLVLETLVVGDGLFHTIGTASTDTTPRHGQSPLMICNICHHQLQLSKSQANNIGTIANVVSTGLTSGKRTRKHESL